LSIAHPTGDCATLTLVLLVLAVVSAGGASAARILALEAQLAQRTAEIEALNKELESFSYSVSHDLKAPLRHISGYVQLLADASEGRLAEEPRRYLDVIAQAGVHMGGLIDDLLSFSRLTRGDMRAVRVAPRDLVDPVIAGMQATRGRNIEWRISEMPLVHADPSMLGIVYEKLIGNAVKYSAPRDPAVIEIGAAGEESGRPVLYVRDNGVGFDMAYADRLFGIFQRLHPREDFEGTGTGLATVQRIIARHGGRVWARAAPGEGATFYFTLGKPTDAPTNSV
jgi:light-regulated signal transduction histidine kinase (bacteriophytochrome)